MKDKDKRLIRIIIILIIIIIILLLLCRCTKKDDGKKLPEYEPKKIEIKDNDKDKDKDKDKNKNKDIDKNKDKDKDKDKDKNNTEKVNKDIDIVPGDSKNNTGNKSNVNNNKPSSGNENNNTGSDDNKEEINEGELVVDWEHNSQLEIFYNTYFNDVKVAPGVSGNYTFEVKNMRINKIKYNISLSDTNTYNINMKYRLKKGNEYVVGDNDSWVTVDEVVYNNQELNTNNKDIYTLEWIWEDADNDTEIGQTVGADYSLNINVYGEDVSE